MIGSPPPSSTRGVKRRSYAYCHPSSVLKTSGGTALTKGGGSSYLLVTFLARPVGCDIAEGQMVLSRRDKLGPSELGLLATVGVTKVLCSSFGEDIGIGRS